MLTVARIVLMPIPGYLLYGGASELFAALVAIIVIGLTDWLDGIMARREGPSVLGGLLDPIADKIFIAMIYLPLTDQGVVPVWMTASIFARDFVVTGLRTSLSLRDAPMRTSLLAKFKTAIQMVGIGYVLLYYTFRDDPDSIWVWTMISLPIALPLSLIVYRFFTRKKQGLRSATMVALMTLAVLMRVILGPETASIVTLWMVTIMTVVSGFSYIMDGWSALVGKSGSFGELLRFLFDGIVIPVVFIVLLGRCEGILTSIAIISMITLELALGGLGNLLGSQKTRPPYKIMAIKSLLQVALGGAALALSFIASQQTLIINSSIIAAAAITLIFSLAEFWRHRDAYLKA